MTENKISPVLQTALKAQEAGISVIPIAFDGSKAPALSSWTEYQSNRADISQIERWFGNGRMYGLAVIGGAVSGNLEFLDFDEPEYFTRFLDASKLTGLNAVVQKVMSGYHELTPGGVHLAWRCKDGVEGNLKLARKIKTDEQGNPILNDKGRIQIDTLIETRGEGGYAIIAPSNGLVHPTKKPYRMVSGGIDQIVEISPDERKEILRLAKCFDQYEQDKPEEPEGQRERSGESEHDENSPGNDFIKKASWETVLTPAGWKRLFTANGVTHWRRPGKNIGISATTGYNGTDYFYCFSTSTEFEPERAYNKFSAYALLYFNSDYAAAAKELNAKGYGPQKTGPGINFTDFRGAKLDTETGEIIEKPDDSKLVDFTATDEGNTQAFIYLYGQDFIYCRAYGWLAWNGKFWDMNLAESMLDAKVTEVLKRRCIAAVEAQKEAVIKASITNRSRINACIEGLSRRLETDVKQFDNEPSVINCLNGVVNLKTGELYPHDKSQKFTYCLPVNYNQNAKPDEWLHFLAQVIGGGQQVIDYLQKALGYTLTGHTQEEILFYCYGPTRSGKGTFTEALLALFGEALSVEADFNTFTAKRDLDASNFDLAPLKPARAVFASESTRYQSLNTAKIKQLTGGNQVRCCFKHKDFFSYRPQYKIWMSSNWPVNGDVDDDALWGRLRVIEFPNSFLGKEDKSLKNKMKSPEVLEGIFNWMVQGAMQWYALGTNGLVTPKVVADYTSSHRTEADYIASWIDECCEVADKEAWTSNEELMTSYKAWCVSNGVEPKQMRSLATTLKARGFLIGVQAFYKGKNHKGVQGIELA